MKARTNLAAGNHRSPVISTLVLLLVAASLHAGSPDEVLAAFGGDNPETAKQLYLVYLRGDSVDSVGIDRCSVLFDHVQDEIDFLAPLAEGSPIIARRVGMLYELMGDLVAAVDHYSTVARSLDYDSGGRELYLRGAMLAVDLGETGLALALVQPLILRGDSDVRVLIVQGQIALVDGDTEAAQIAVERVLQSQDLGAGALLWAHDSAEVLGFAAGVDQALSRLTGVPGGPALLQADRFPSVLRYLGITALVSEEAVPVVTAPTGGLDILVGSFSNPENAQSLRGRLRTAGYEATIREILLGGSRYHRVVVPTLLDQVQDVLTALKELGYEATPLY